MCSDFIKKSWIHKNSKSPFRTPERTTAIFYPKDLLTPTYVLRTIFVYPESCFIFMASCKEHPSHPIYEKQTTHTNSANTHGHSIWRQLFLSFSHNLPQKLQKIGSNKWLLINSNKNQAELYLLHCFVQQLFIERKKTNKKKNLYMRYKPNKYEKGKQRIKQTKRLAEQSHTRDFLGDYL